MKKKSGSGGKVLGEQIISVTSKKNYWIETLKKNFHIKIANLMKLEATWTDFEKFLKIDYSEEEFPSEISTQIVEIHQIYQKAQNYVQSLLIYLTNETTDIMNRLKNDLNFDLQDERTQCGLFVKKIESNRWKDLFFLAKKGILTAEFVKKKYTSPMRFIYNYEKFFHIDQ